MDYLKDLKYHFKPKKGWMNDPNGLVFFKGYFHAFYQHCPTHEQPWTGEYMHWGHARTKDYLNWEELPVALTPEHPYENQGCWSGTAIVKDDMLYLLYASVTDRDGERYRRQTVSVAYSKDGLHFEKYEKNPVIPEFPGDGSADFRDPAVFCEGGKYYCVMASGRIDIHKARLLIYESENLLDWEYKGIMYEVDNANVTECPSIVRSGDKTLVAMSVLTPDNHFFEVGVGSFKDGKFNREYAYNFDKGPDQYAGQAYNDDKGRPVILSWIPGWGYSEFAERSVSCLSLPREMTLRDGKVLAYPIKELQHLLRDTDEAVTMTDEGFTVKRAKGDITHIGKVNDIKMLRDEYVLEIFVNGGEINYTVIL